MSSTDHTKTQPDLDDAVRELFAVVLARTEEFARHRNYLLGKTEDAQESELAANYMTFLEIRDRPTQISTLDRVLSQVEDTIESTADEIMKGTLPHYLTDRFDHLKDLLASEEYEDPEKRKSLIWERARVVVSFMSTCSDRVSALFSEREIDKEGRTRILARAFERYKDIAPPEQEAALPEEELTCPAPRKQEPEERKALCAGKGFADSLEALCEPDRESAGKDLLLSPEARTFLRLLNKGAMDGLTKQAQMLVARYIPGLYDRRAQRLRSEEYTDVPQHIGERLRAVEKGDEVNPYATHMLAMIRETIEAEDWARCGESILELLATLGECFSPVIPESKMEAFYQAAADGLLDYLADDPAIDEKLPEIKAGIVFSGLNEEWNHLKLCVSSDVAANNEGETDSDLYNRIGVISYLTGAWVCAVEFFEKARNAAKIDPEVSSLTVRTICMNLVVAYLSNRETLAGIQLFKKLRASS